MSLAQKSYWPGPMILLAGLFVFPSWLAAQEPVGYEGSIPARQLSPTDRGRIWNLPIQDLLDYDSGRYAVLEDDGQMGHWGLSEIWARRDVADKPYAELRDLAGIYQTERTVFADLSTGLMLMKLTNQPYNDGGDELLYFGKSNFSADGARMIWTRSSTVSLWGPGSITPTDEYGPLMLDGDGTRPRIVFSSLNPFAHLIAHPFDPDLAYARVGYDLVEVNLTSEEVLRTVAEDVVRWWMKISPDGEYVCGSGDGRITVTATSDGTSWDIPLSSGIHDSYRFVPGNTDWIMFWYEGSFPTSELANYKTSAGITSDIGFDWNHGDVGSRYGVHTSGRIWQYNEPNWDFLTGVTWPEYDWQDSGPFYDVVFHTNGYLAYHPDDQLWSYPTRIIERPHLSELEALWVKPFTPGGGRTNRFRLCLTNLYRYNDRTGVETEVLDRPNISRDGTKILFNSNVFGKAEVYLVVIKKPMAPIDVAAQWAAGTAQISWSHPHYHQEIVGYDIYRSSESGHGFQKITQAPVASTNYTDLTAQAGTAYYYAVRSVEHSRLESELSAEAATASSPALIDAQALRLFAEAEEAIPADLAAQPPDGFWLNVEGMASNYYYIWQRRSDIPGSASIEMDIPRNDSYFIYARVKGDDQIGFTIAGQALSAAASSDWQWVRSAGAAALSSGPQMIDISSSQYGSRLDCFYLSTDPDFVPLGRVSANLPAQLLLSCQTQSGYPLLTWAASQDPRFYYYNLYVSDNPDFSPSRETLIASPDSTSYLDWQALEGTKYYKLTQVSLDGLESEASNACNPEGNVDPEPDEAPDGGLDADGGSADSPSDGGSSDNPTDQGPLDDGGGTEKNNGISGSCGCSPGGQDGFKFGPLLLLSILAWVRLRRGKRRNT